MGVDSRLLQMPDIIQCLAVEGFNVPDIGIARRKSPVVFAAGRCGIDRDKICPIGAAQISLPCLPIALCVPVTGVIIPRGRRVPVVQHGIERHLVGDVYFPAIPGQHTECCRHSPACTLTSDHDLIGADTQFLRMLLQPEQGGVTVLQGSGIGMVLGQPVVGSNQHSAELDHQ